MCKNLESHFPTDAVFQVWLKLVLEKKIFNFVNALFYVFFPLEKSVAPHLKNFEFPLPKDAFCQVWFKLEKSVVIYLNKLWILFIQVIIVPNKTEVGPVFLEK